MKEQLAFDSIEFLEHKAAYFISPRVTGVNHVSVISLVEEVFLSNGPNADVTGINGVTFANGVGTHQRDHLKQGRAKFMVRGPYGNFWKLMPRPTEFIFQLN